MLPGKGNIKAISTSLITIMVTCVVLNSVAQISPGDLSSSHAQIEGILNCTKCHVLGDKVSNDKCLECHKEIKNRISQKKGYHASSEVRGRDCFACHSDHHGRNFEIVRFDTERFNHQLTGYSLTGAHQELECKVCHKEEFIESYDLKKKKDTYLGLNTECNACHKDVHQNTLSQNCASCHNTEDFIPAALFEHGKTDFPLKGKHEEVDCKSCHEITFNNNALFQRFADIPFKSCANCHDDPHNNQFGTNCSSCHTEESFNEFVGKNTFNHNQTQYPLIGKHRKVDCTSCHQIGGTMEAEDLFRDYEGKDFHNCIVCHQDVHETKFGSDCKKCHTEESFQKVLSPDKFEHDLTGYPLEGKHEVVDCRKCHESKLTDPLPHQVCMDCHADHHEGQFVNEKVVSDCKDCHSEEGFTESLYTLERHNEGPFPLVGAHLATPCISCHLDNGEWSFRNIGKNCNDCHVDVHAGALNEKYYPGKTCDQCHTAMEWADISFDHLQTGYELLGKHRETTCIACHIPENTNITDIIIPFSGLSTRCNSCHENIHGGQFEEEGVTDCSSCHDAKKWKPSNFDHNTARFVLDGAHKNVDCRECHKEEVVEGVMVVQYAMEQIECATCHE